ncbi:hypothetical protein HRbin17_02470 [bacterium HR17]|uniref:Uncharacterized protein n=1 Tax=Candidatus Fervidibacter japonicus TaxID=2035412 RepID=A0A2H5XFL2_9BACT|nr:hypothetical protein HRbin17_02470 [bacterium HR17]
MAVDETFVHQFTVEPDGEPIFAAEQQQCWLRSFAGYFSVGISEPVTKLPELRSFLTHLLCNQSHEVQDAVRCVIALPSHFAQALDIV